MNIYAEADSAIRTMNRKNLKAFNLLKLAKWDEISIIRAVSAAYEESARMAKRKYQEIAQGACLTALKEAGVSEAIASGMAMDEITTDWILDMLEEVDQVTLYAFLPEMERKKQRLIEALAAAQNRNAEIDKALRYWAVQVGQYADNSVYRARLDAFRITGIERVRWVTQKDERVCGDCDSLDEQIFQIDSVPPPQHIHCRCFIVPVLD